MLPFPLFLALKYLKPKRSLAVIIPIITVLGIMLGVAILMIVLAVMTGFGDEWRDKILSFKPHITIYHKSGLIQDTESACSLIEAIEGVKTVSPTIVSPVMLRYDERMDPVMATVIGIDGDRSSIISRQIASGENLFAGGYNVSGNNVMIGRDLAKRLSVPVGATLLCYSPLNLNSENALYFPEELVVAGVYDTGMRDIDDLIAITSLGMARDIVGIDDGAQTIQVQTSNPEMAWREAAEIEAALGPGFKASTWHQEDQVLFQTLRTEKTMMFILLAFIAIVAAFCVTNTLIVITIQKTREIGLLKALGFSGGQIKAAFVLHGLILCVTGIVIGLLAGCLVLRNLQGMVALLARFGMDVFPKEIYGLAKIPWRIVPEDIISVVSTVFVFCTAASYLPAHYAAHLDPVKAINQE